MRFAACLTATLLLACTSSVDADPPAADDTCDPYEPTETVLVDPDGEGGAGPHNERRVCCTDDPAACPYADPCTAWRMCSGRCEYMPLPEGQACGDGVTCVGLMCR